jgi:hypothetical protein
MADAARGEEDNYYYLPAWQADALTLKQPLYPKLLTEKSDNQIMDRMMDEQRQHIEALDDDVLKIPKSLVAYVGGKSPETHELNNVIIEKVTQWGLKIPVDALSYGLVLAFTNTHKLSPSYSEFLNTLTSADTAIADTVKWLKNHYHLFDLSGMTDDEFMSKRVGNHELFGLLADDTYRASSSLKARIDKLKSESPEAIAFVNELTAFIRVTGEELMESFPNMPRSIRVNNIAGTVVSRYGDEAGKIEYVTDNELSKMIGAFIDSATVKPPVVTQEYMASADGKYGAIKFAGYVNGCSDEFKNYCKSKGEGAKYVSSVSSVIPQAPKSSWTARIDLIESYFAAYPNTVIKYNIVRV